MVLYMASLLLSCAMTITVPRVFGFVPRHADVTSDSSLTDGCRRRPVKSKGV